VLKFVIFTHLYRVNKLIKLNLDLKVRNFTSVCFDLTWNDTPLKIINILMNTLGITAVEA
jgi:hypothetical protein